MWRITLHSKSPRMFPNMKANSANKSLPFRARYSMAQKGSTDTTAQAVSSDQGIQRASFSTQNQACIEPRTKRAFLPPQKSSYKEMTSPAHSATNVTPPKAFKSWVSTEKLSQGSISTSQSALENSSQLSPTIGNSVFFPPQRTAPDNCIAWTRSRLKAKYDYL